MIKPRRRQKPVTENDIVRIRELSALNLNQIEIAMEIDVTPATVGKYQRKFEIPHMDRTEARRVSVAKKGGARYGQRSRRSSVRDSAYAAATSISNGETA